MDLDELRAFLAVAQSGSVLAAAESLSLPRTTLRRRLDDLEARMGTPLLYRGVQGAVLTAAGELVAERAKRILEEASVLMTSVREMGSTATGTLRVAIPVGLPPHASHPIFQLCRTNHPNLAIDASVQENPLDALGKGADLVLHFGPRVPDGPWVTRVLMNIPLVLLGSKSYLERKGMPEKVEDLSVHTLLSWRGPGQDPYRWPLREGGVLKVEPALISNDIHSLRQVMLAGQGLTLLPDGIQPEPNEESQLVRILEGQLGQEVPLRVVVPEPMARAPKIRALQESILAFLEDF